MPRPDTCGWGHQTRLQGWISCLFIQNKPCWPCHWNANQKLWFSVHLLQLLEKLNIFVRMLTPGVTALQTTRKSVTVLAGGGAWQWCAGLIEWGHKQHDLVITCPRFWILAQNSQLRGFLHFYIDPHTQYLEKAQSTVFLSPHWHCDTLPKMLHQQSNSHVCEDLCRQES